MYCENLKKIREDKGLTKKQMSDLIGIPYTTYVGYETLVREPKKEQVNKIANMLNVSVAYLLGFIDDPNPHPWLDAFAKLELTDSPLYQSGIEKYVTDSNGYYVTEFRKLLDQLNINGKKEAIKRVRELTLNEEYTKELTNTNDSTS